MVIRPKQSVSFKIGNHFRAGIWLCSLLLLGCGSNVYQSAPVDEGKASDTLTMVLDSWQEGETPDSLQEQSPKVVVQDLDWSSGMKLMSYEVVGEPKAVNANLIAKVKLSLQDKSGSASEKTVTYLVGTSPALTVFRDMLK